MLIKTDKDTIQSYLEDSSNLKGGYVEKVVIPGNIAELVSFMKEANAKKIPVTISGGGTGTTGSRIPFGGTVLSMEKFDKISEVSGKSMSAVAGAGVLVEDLKAAAEKKGLFYTSHPTEKTAAVGGTVATNASGSRSFRYGPTRKYVRRLKMVLACGEVVEIARGQRHLTRADPAFKLPGGREIIIPIPAYKMPDIKSSAGYFAKDGMDMIDLFIGQEGTLSVITEVEMGLVDRPVSIFSCFVFFKNEGDSWDFAEELKKTEALNILSVEYFDHNAVRLLAVKNKNIPEGANAAIFFEQDTSGKNTDALIGYWEKMICDHNASLDTTWVAMNERDAALFTQLRYSVPEAVNDIIRRTSYRKFSTDIAVPGDKFREMVSFYVDTFKKEKLEHVIFGHIGENHLHVNILPGSDDEMRRAQELSLLFVRKGISLGGTVSAEHGIGKLKHAYLEEMYGTGGVREMVKIKKALDPNCILGVGNIFPKENLI
ncbi:MAG: FAD-binding oxidoreductase [Candidatus Omnitrophica bacterium]|nr:FAD-binding oxidoreductase [Candidatus Omnitrophota bacterium]